MADDEMTDDEEFEANDLDDEFIDEPKSCRKTWRTSRAEVSFDDDFVDDDDVSDSDDDEVEVDVDLDVVAAPRSQGRGHGHQDQARR